MSSCKYRESTLNVNSFLKKGGSVLEYEDLKRFRNVSPFIEQLRGAEIQRFHGAPFGE